MKRAEHLVANMQGVQNLGQPCLEEAWTQLFGYHDSRVGPKSWIEMG